jgi:hypothetical protein
MLKIVEIAKAWIAAANPTPEQKAIAEYRIKICDGCEAKKAEPILQIYICGDCGCPLNKKIFSPKPGKEACPKSYWEK